MTDEARKVRLLDKLSHIDKLTYNVGEAARMLGVSGSAIYHKISDGNLAVAPCIFGRVVKKLREDLERVVAEAKERPLPLAAYAASASGSGSSSATATHGE